MSAPPSPSGERREAARRLVVLIAATLAARLVVGGLSHLTEDEAYYRLWSFAPALGYFDHPPMIAWWIWLGRQVAGDTALAVRLLPSLGCALSTVLIFDAARLSGEAEKTALVAAILFNATVLVGAGGFLAVPDAPASLFWIAAIWAALKARQSRPWWLAAGAFAGLAALSKYSALFLAPGMGLWLLCGREGRTALRGPWPWLGAALAIALFSLNVAWNADHAWPTFSKQFGRVTRGAFAPIHLPEFLLAQVLLANPLIALLAARALTRGQSASALAPFVLTSVPFVLYLAVHALHAQVEAHWPAPTYAGIAVLAAAGAQGAPLAWRRVARLAPWFGFTVNLIAFAWILAPAWALPPVRDPALAIRGWPSFGANLEAERRRAGAAWIGTLSYGLTAQLADERAVKAPIMELKERARYLDLPLGRPDLSRPGLVVDLPRRMDLSALGRCFASVQSDGVLRRGEAGGPTQAYLAARVSGPRVDVIGAGCPP